MNYHKKIVPVDQLREIVQRAQAEGKTVVQCHGCFDILHPGHLRHLGWAKGQGDLLIVSVSADKVVNKGFLRPYVPEGLRAENLAALEMVDYVTIDDGEWAGPILDLIRPNIYIKGKEFQDVFDGRFGRERQLVESYGGQMRFSSGDVVYSSTKIIEDFKDRLEPGMEPVQAFCKRHNITEDSIRRTLESIRGKKILVVGDTIVDRYIYCDSLGMSAEAPVLVVRPHASDMFVGGAGIVAEHVQSLGATAHFCTIVGKDPEGEYVQKQLERRHLATEFVFDTTRPTTLKTRYLSGGKKLLNINQFRDHNLDPEVGAQLRERILVAGADADAIVISDFSYGVITAGVLEALCNLGRERNVPVIGDVQCSSQMGNVARMKGITMTTPSEREARIALCDRESGIADLGAHLLTVTGNKSLLITLADRGVMIFEIKDKPLDEEARSMPQHELKKMMWTEYLPSFSRYTVDPMGAGDAMLATTACALAAGCSIMQATYLGNCGAAVECSKVGNIPLGREELQAVARAQFQEAAV
ncbi:MAG TPA: PfkB family carbohydrate kinase [Verrucomicrobiae bacterium]|nr:PfkB family carbohydrate kinase [Verrucomicrobiae bacterium]